MSESLQTNNSDMRRAIFPIDGKAEFLDVLNVARDFFSNEDVLPFVSMVKLNDALHLSHCGPEILGLLREELPEHVKLFIDLKIVDVKQTVLNTLKRYVPYRPDIVTVFSGVTAETLLTVRKVLPETKIALVDTLTDMSPVECMLRFNMTPEEKIARAIYGFDDLLSKFDNPIDIIVCGVEDLKYLRAHLGERFEFLCPGIRDRWMIKKGNKDHQKRISGVYKALKAGATYVVVGTQLSEGNPKAGITPEESRRRTWNEMHRYFSERSAL
jgi:orotidine-5'-phosphate decarboxylase